MDDPVRRRSFVRLATTETIQTAGRLAGMSALAGRIVADSISNLTALGEPDDAGGPEGVAAAPPTPPRAPRPATPAPAPLSVPTTHLDARTAATLAATHRLLVAVNRSQAGPLVLPFPVSWVDGVGHITTRSTSAIAQAIRSDGRVTLLLDDPETDQRILVFGIARLLEGPDLVDDTAGSRPDPDAARIEVSVSHAIRTPL